MTVTPSQYARDLLSELGLKESPGTPEDSRNENSLWAASGAQLLTGEREGPPLGAPAPLATCAQGAWLALCQLSKGSIARDFPAHKLLGERAALLNLQRQGKISAGGACRLLNCLDGQLALSLTREADWRLLPAWLEMDADSWDTIAPALLERSCKDLITRAHLLGLAAAPSCPPTDLREWFNTIRLAPEKSPRHNQPLVIDLSSLWAGPLCTQILGQLGARVIKVESTTRPDGARHGAPPFFDLLNTNKQSVALDLATTHGQWRLGELLRHADIIVESSRPRALEQMGIRAHDIVRERDGCVWLSITGYGRTAPAREWIAYGDDAGVAAGLSWLLREATGSDAFCGDAIADPLTGIHAALLTWAAWSRGGGVLLDVSLYGVIAHCIAAGCPDEHQGSAASSIVTPSSPHARSASSPAPALGSGTTAVLEQLGIGL
ncbi:MAG: CoA transferase [Halioglobus sp.]|nr:CoA transferase [Halioglobus sp.]